MSRILEGDNGSFLLDTTLAVESEQTLRAMTHFGMTMTDGLNQAVDVHRWLTGCHALGGLVVAETMHGLETIDMPEEIARGGDTHSVHVRIVDRHKPYLESLVDEYDREDLVQFWAGAVTLTASLAERGALEQPIYELLPGPHLYHVRVGVGPLAETTKKTPLRGVFRKLIWGE